MRVMSFNANGIRAAQRKGFFEWMAAQDPDVVCIQELKAQQHQLEGIEAFWPVGYHCFYEEATSRKGYSGVAIYSKREPDAIIRGMGHEEFDAEGRYIEARYKMDRPLYEQYFSHLWSTVQFDFGPSFRLEDYSVNEVIAQGFPVSASLGIFAMVFALTLGMTAGVVSAVRRTFNSTELISNTV